MGMFAALLRSLKYYLWGAGQPEPESHQQLPTHQSQQGPPVTRPRPQQYYTPPQYYRSSLRHEAAQPQSQSQSVYPPARPVYPPARPVHSPAPPPYSPLPPPRPKHPPPPPPRPNYPPPPTPKPHYTLPPPPKPSYSPPPPPKPTYSPPPAPRLEYPLPPARARLNNPFLARLNNPFLAAKLEYPPVAVQPELERPPAQHQPARQASPGPDKVRLLGIIDPCGFAERPKQNLCHEPEIRQDSDYQALRARANEESAKMAQSFKESRKVRANDRARAQVLSTQAHAHKAEMERLNERASSRADTKVQHRAPGEVDLHDLHVKEAITYTERAVQDARRRGDTKINLIVGKGLHSRKGVAKLRPAIKKLLETQGLVVDLDPRNSGVLIVNLDGRPTDTDSVLSVDEILSRFEYEY
ncbi:hypothetical protein EVJ58_g1540 [Rhodofomes roseus]|uniref:Smr domain-containing protein n=1 Tax=Rhodofomes roseus TaxID=34475 RepID=A0A4Y9YYX7_9APHY|nr:hypothetical protein EVJ58_g1540 [Rhodofomes roseus]